VAPHRALRKQPLRAQCGKDGGVGEGLLGRALLEDLQRAVAISFLTSPCFPAQKGSIHKKPLDKTIDTWNPLHSISEEDGLYEGMEKCHGRDG
jgi:hypothetical protein